jgi:hypothetical protein
MPNYSEPRGGVAIQGEAAFVAATQNKLQDVSGSHTVLMPVMSSEFRRWRGHPGISPVTASALAGGPGPLFLAYFIKRLGDHLLLM